MYGNADHNPCRLRRRGSACGDWAGSGGACGRGSTRSGGSACGRRTCGRGRGTCGFWGRQSDRLHLYGRHQSLLRSSGGRDQGSGRVSRRHAGIYGSCQRFQHADRPDWGSDLQRHWSDLCKPGRCRRHHSCTWYAEGCGHPDVRFRHTGGRYELSGFLRRLR